MERLGSKRFSQFSMLAVLGLIALIAMLMVPISCQYRALMNRPDVFASAMLMIGPQGADSSNYLAQFDTDSFCQHVLDDPKIRSLPAVSNSPDPRDWLMNHLSVRAVGNLIEIHFRGRSERVSARHLQTLLETTIEVIRADPEETNMPVTVVSTTRVDP